MSSADDIATLKTELGALDPEINYLYAKGVRTVRQLAKCCVDERGFMLRFLAPYQNGVTISQVEHKVERDFDSACTAMLVMQEEAKIIRQKEVAGPVAAALPAAAAHPPAAAGAAKAPTIMDKAVWSKQIARWQDQWSPARLFPSKMVLGAEHILLRLMHESQNSKVYTPLLLSEVAAARTYNEDGSLNERRKQAGGQTTVQQLAALVVQQHGSGDITYTQTDDSSFADSSWACADCLDATMWALRFCEYGTDEETEDWRNFWKKIIRSQRIQSDMNVLLEVYSVVEWRIALEQREGTTWATSAKSIINDGEYLKQQVEDGKAKRNRRNQQDGRWGAKRGASQELPRIHNKHAKQYNRTDSQQRGQDEHRRSISPGGTPLCRNFNQGTCKLTDHLDHRSGRKRCRFAHICWTCRDDRCEGAESCRRAPRRESSVKG